MGRILEPIPGKGSFHHWSRSSSKHLGVSVPCSVVPGSALKVSRHFFQLSSITKAWPKNLLLPSPVPLSGLPPLPWAFIPLLTWTVCFEDCSQLNLQWWYCGSEMLLYRLIPALMVQFNPFQCRHIAEYIIYSVCFYRRKKLFICDSTYL